ncbi:NYN domain-containing protein [Sphingomonas morindae]|uniref:NYN domain-containing protein n=1 Tax=Sphingomonas morindae TaxID=1541170 RepID=A0ABY4X431_9SPHN|nr:NYN domain-containing protein [Sphingomonas morindae]USI71649.1 NYN domain-containing protein [Sphingomonas morindae]
MSEQVCQVPPRPRAAVYVDGFNLYHPIHDLGPAENHLKWSSLWTLGKMLAEQVKADLVKVVFCTAVPKHLPDSRDRHNTFNRAQRSQGVVILKGHHVPDDGGYSEKQSDINVALSLILDGLDNVYDIAIVLSADSDQVATGHAFRRRLAPSGKQMFCAVPLGRSMPIGFSELGVKKLVVTKAMLETCVMPEQVVGADGSIRRPAAYDPPVGWVHPNDRPKQKPPKPPKAWGKAVRTST